MYFVVQFVDGRMIGLYMIINSYKLLQYLEKLWVSLSTSRVPYLNNFLFYFAYLTSLVSWVNSLAPSVNDSRFLFPENRNLSCRPSFNVYSFRGRMVIFSTDMRSCKTATIFVTLNCYKYEQNCVICSLLIHYNLKQITVVYSNWIPSNSDKQCISKCIKKALFQINLCFKVN